MKDGARPNILIVDDTPANLYSMKKVLESLEVNIVLANSGNAALTLMLKHDFMLILLDVNMPIMDGYETAEHIMCMDEYKHIPIIFVTAFGEDGKLTAYGAGAVDYLSKPVDSYVLMSKVNVFLKLYEQKIELLDQKRNLADLLVKKDELLLKIYEHQKQDALLIKIQEQSRRLKLTFGLCAGAFIIIVGSISFMYSIISTKNSQLVNYTELLNEKNILFSDIKNALMNNSDPDIKFLLQKLNTEDIKLLTQSWESEPAAWNWKKKIPSSAGEGRYKIVSIVAQLANMAAARDKFIIPTEPADTLHDTPGWLMYGSKDKTSDIDYTIAPVSNQKRLFYNNAIQGRKAIMASIIFRSLFGDTSLNLIDTEFYPPQIGTFLNGPVNSRVSFLAIFSQMANFFNSNELQSFEQELSIQYRALTFKEENILIEILKDSDILFKDIKAIKRMVPNPELANNIVSNKITLAMSKLGDEIDSLETNNVNRPNLVETYAFLDILRTHFLPEGYISRGAFKVVCENFGGQKHQLSHKRIEEDYINNKINQATANRLSKIESEGRSASTFQDLFESFGENVAFYHHRSDIIDASKYGVRVYESALEIINQLKNSTDDINILNKIKKIQAEAEQKLVEMSILESEKRGKLSEISFNTIFEKITVDELKVIATINKAESEKAASIIMNAAKTFFQEAKFGGDKFSVMTPEQRILNFKISLNKIEFSVESLALLESVARVKNPIHQEALYKLIMSESKNEISKMKETRKITAYDDAILYDIVKAEMRDIFVKIMTISLKTGILEFPEPLINPKFIMIESDVKHTVSNLLSNTLNLEN